MIVDRAPSSYRIFGPSARGVSGLGQPPAGGGIGPGTLNCPSDPECFFLQSSATGAPAPADNVSMLAAPLSAQQIAALSAYNAAQFGQTSPYAPLVPATPSGIVNILNQNPTLVYWGLGIVVVLAFLSEGRR